MELEKRCVISVNSMARRFIPNMLLRDLNQQRRGRILFLLLVFSVSINILYYVQYLKTLKYFTSQQQREDPKMLCFDKHRGLTTPLAEGLIMKPDIPPSKWTPYHSKSLLLNKTDQRIFFHETSGRNDISMSQCCAIESAANNNPNRPVQLFLRPSVLNCSSDMKEPDQSTLLYNPTWLQVLSKYPNVEVILLNEEEYFHGSLFEDWYKRGEWRKSQFQISHLSDYLRIESLLKGGGTYLDIDVITLKPYEGEQLRNFIGYTNVLMDDVNGSAMHFERGHRLINEIAKLIAKEYEPNSYIFNGPEAILQVLISQCGLVAKRPKSNRCKDVHLLPDYFFYPIPPFLSNELFEDDGNKSDEVMKKLSQSYGVHLWYSIDRLHQPARIDSNQAFAKIARQHCPVTVISRI